MSILKTKSHNNWSAIEQWFAQHADQLAGLFIFVFIATGVFTLRYYGLTWDESLGNLFYGERYLRFFTSLDFRFLDFSAEIPAFSQNSLRLFPPFNDPPYIFPPLADTLSAAGMYVFSYWLNWLNPIDGYHIFTILLVGIFLWVVYRFVSGRLGKFIAFLSIFFLGTFPRFWGDMHFNVKDVPETVFFSCALMAYWAWYEKPRLKQAMLAGLMTGCALAVKANALFIPVILTLTILPWSLHLQPWMDLVKHFKKYFLQYIVMASSAICLYFFSWPYLYSNPYQGLKAYWGFIFRLATRGGANWQIDPLRQALATMPEVMLAFFIIGLSIIIYRMFHNKMPFWRLLFFWAIVPILRVSIPSAVNFDGIRHYLEFVPAAAILASVGAERSVQWLTSRNGPPTRVSLRVFLLVLVALNLIQINRLFFPYLHLYYNQIVGGLSGARDHFLGREATDYWAGNYRPGMEWLNDNAPPNSKLVVPVAPWVAALEAPVLLRPDIQIIPSMPDRPELDASKDPFFIMFILRAGLGNAADEVEIAMKYGDLVHQIVVDHVPILYIYRFGGE